MPASSRSKQSGTGILPVPPLSSLRHSPPSRAPTGHRIPKQSGTGILPVTPLSSLRHSPPSRVPTGHRIPKQSGTGILPVTPLILAPCSSVPCPNGTPYTKAKWHGHPACDPSLILAPFTSVPCPNGTPYTKAKWHGHPACDLSAEEHQNSTIPHASDAHFQARHKPATLLPPIFKPNHRTTPSNTPRPVRTLHTLERLSVDPVHPAPHTKPQPHPTPRTLKGHHTPGNTSPSIRSIRSIPSISSIPHPTPIPNPIQHPAS